MGWLENALQIAKGLIPEINAQAKAQFTESGNVTGLSVHVGDNIYVTKFPEGTDIRKVMKLELTPEVEKLVEKEVTRQLLANKDRITNLPERDRNQLIVDYSATSIASTATSAKLSVQPPKDREVLDFDGSAIGEGANITTVRSTGPHKTPRGSDEGETA